MARMMSVLVLLAVGCGGGDGGSSGDDQGASDASISLDSAASSDAPSGPALHVVWVATPALPGPVSATVTVAAAAFFVSKLEVIGDAGDPAETTQRDFNLAWSAVVQPFQIAFFNAPPAIYSKVRIGIDKAPSNAPAIEITGTVTISSVTEMFHVISRKKVDLEVTGYNLALSVGGSGTVDVDVGLDVALGNINWMALPVMAGARTLDDDNLAMDDFVDDLDNTFTAN